MGTFHMAAAAPLGGKRGAQAGIPVPLFKAGWLGLPALQRRGGPRAPESQAAALPLPPRGNRVRRPPFS